MVKRKPGRANSTRIQYPLLFLIGVLCAVALGCASPGQPRPPSLHLPRIVDDLTADRTGDAVRLRWTTPSVTTDHLAAPPMMTAVLCRQTGAVSSRSGEPCVEVKRLPVQPGASATEDELPVDLASEPTRLLAYRVEILSPAGRSAGRSGEAYAAAGAAPPRVEGLTAVAARDGVRLHWTTSSPETSIELDRTDLTHGQQVNRPKQRSVSLPIAPKPRPVTRLSARAAGEPDAGGTIDQSAQKGDLYQYTAQRIRQVSVVGHDLLIRSAAAAPVHVEVIDSFPPQPPAELRAASGGGAQASIDLSWQPGTEVDLAGYNVYRSEVPVAGPPGPTSWRRLNESLVTVPGFADATVGPGVRYAYRVTAVDTRGHESAPGNEVQGILATR